MSLRILPVIRHFLCKSVVFSAKSFRPTRSTLKSHQCFPSTTTITGTSYIWICFSGNFGRGNLGPLRDPFLERPGNLTGPESDFDIKVSGKVERVLTYDEVHFDLLAHNFTVQFSNLLKPPLEWKTKQLNGPGNYRELRETGPRIVVTLLFSKEDGKEMYKDSKRSSRSIVLLSKPFVWSRSYWVC